MLMKANAPDPCATTFVTWRAMLPHWNSEADRFRRLALAVRNGETAVHGGAVDEAEALSARIRQAMELSDSLMTMTAPGDASLGMLLRAGAEFESLLDSLQTSLEILDLVAGRPARHGLHVIAHASGPVAG